MPCIRILINDGFTLAGTIPARRGLWDEFGFKYRPALPDRVAGYLRAPRETGKAVINAMVSLLKEHLVAWDAKDEDGNVLVLNEATLRAVYEPVLTQLVDAVCGYSPADMATDEKNSERASG